MRNEAHYERSIIRTLRGSGDRTITHTEGLIVLARRLPRAVPVVRPLDVLAMLTAESFHNVYSNKFNTAFELLASRGWNITQTTHMHAKIIEKLRCLHTPADMARLMTRQQLCEAMGLTYGDMLADVIVDPGSAPVLYAMLYGNIMEPVDLTFSQIRVDVSYDEETLRQGPEAFKYVPIPDPLTSKPFLAINLNTETAQRLYYDATGGSLPTRVQLE